MQRRQLFNFRIIVEQPSNFRQTFMTSLRGDVIKCSLNAVYRLRTIQN